MSKAVIISLSALLLVGLVAAVTFGVATNWGKPKTGDGVATSTKAVQAICQPTDYKEACFKSLSNVNSDDPKELVKAAFESAKNEINTVVAKSQLLQDLEKNPDTMEAVKDCKELFQDAIDDLQRSFQEIGEFEWEKMNQMLGNLKSWLSATITYQETCLDGFENTTGDASVKVRKLLQTSRQMSSNGLAIVTDLSSLFGTIDFSSFNRRRLLATPIGHELRGMDHDDRTRYWLDKVAKNRRLLNDDNGDGKDDGDKTLLKDEEGDQRRRKLLSMNENDHVPDWLQGNRRELLGAINLSEDLKAKANVVVAQDGSGKHKTIEEALNEAPKNSKDPYIIYIKEGVYKEYLVVQKWMQHLVFVGDGPTKTRITNDKNFVDGVKTFKTATLSVLGDFFMAKDIGIENSAGAIKHQAVALRVQSDQSIFYNCHMDGYQDTLYAHTYRQFYRDCRITGTIDFIFGDAAAFFQNCTFVIRKPLDNQRCIVTAQGRMERHQPTGIIIHRSRFEGDPEYMPVKDKNQAFLGRPWKEYSKTIIMESYIENMIQPDGWLPWEGNFGLDTCYYGEYNNEGPGSELTQRVKWRGIKTIGHTRADKFMPHLLYETDAWIIDSGVPYEPSLFAAAPGPASLEGGDEDPNAPTGEPTGEDSGSSDSKESSKGESSDSKKSSKGSSEGGSSSSSSSSSSSHDSKKKEHSKGSSDDSQKSSKGSSTDHKSSSSSSSDSSSGSSSDGKSSNSDSKDSSSSSSGSSSSTSYGSYSSDTPPLISSPSPIEAQVGTTAPTPLLVPAPAPMESPLAPAPTQLEQSTISMDSPSTQVPGSSPSLSPSESPEQNKIIGPVSMKELERMLMANEEIEEGQDEEANDDMSGNVPDGDEPSPAMVQPPSPAPSPSITLSPSLSPGPSPGPSSDEISDWLPPDMAPEPNTELEPSDKVSPPPKSNSATKSRFEFSVILTGLAILASLAM